MCHESGKHGVDWGKSRVSVKGTRGVRALEVTANNGKTETYLSIYNLVKPQNPQIIEYISDIQREGRKVFNGVVMATQSLRGLVPENATSDVSEKLKEVFEFTQYKFFLHFDSNVLPLLKKVAGEQLTETEIQRIGRYKRGDALLSISGGENIEFHVEATKEELSLFKGGV